MWARLQITSSLALLAVLSAGAVYWATLSSGASPTLLSPGGDSELSKAVAAQQNPRPTVTVVEPGDATAFSALGVTGSGLPAAFATMVNGGPLAAQYGVNTTLARPVAGGSGAWLIPGDGGLCLWLTDAGGKSGGLGCATTAKAVAGELSESRMSEAGVQHVVGVVPDGTTAVTLNGKPLTVVDNGWEAVTGPQPANIEITTSGGTKTVEVP